MKQNTIKVLLIEDNPNDYQLYQEMLEKSGSISFELTWKERLSDGLQCLLDPSLDLLVLDLFLPETRGLNTLRKIQEKVSNMPIVVLTRLDDETLGMEAVREGAQEYLVKGHIDQYNLQRSIRHALERHQTEEALRKSEERYRNLAEKLQQANAELESFTYSVSHDLRAPLRAITGFSEIINRRYRNTLEEEVQHYLDNIIQAGTQMGWLIDDLLAYSRLGRGSLSMESVALDDLIQKVFRSFQARIEETNAEISIQDAIPMVQSNKSLLNQIFSNLINNALTYHKPEVPPFVEISWSKEKEHVIICVSDRGIGVEAEFYDKIFDVFHRLETQGEYPGTGIGLAIVKKAVDLLKGQVWIESAPNEGSQFFVKLLLPQKKHNSIEAFWEGNDE